ncbi:hypothetical protein JOQ06_029470 [Pogonophryne albipinna]|uniref:Uncharacterized protein n=1 Tax=Pogonophryne albipinna TaxID=1090488 RepID=A0AAD6BA05_9TELE|nr:hypothetical protein JOQ06_029470 [Pogonophryne albipinna]
MSEYNGAVTLDMWTDDYRKISYLCHTIHYINSKWELVERVLSTSEWDSTERRLNDLSEDTLNAMVMFLQRFKEATKALEASKTPTLHLTAVWLDRLKRHLQPSSTDNLTFSSLKAKCLRILVEKYEIHLLHKLAMFLHPTLKSLKLLVEEHSMETVHNEVRRLVNDIKERRSTPTQRVATVSSAPPGKRTRQSEGLSNVEDSSSSDECTQDEVSAYIRARLFPSTGSVVV